MYKYPGLLSPSVAGRESLQPLYTKLNDAIRAGDSDHIIFFEPVSPFTAFPLGPLTTTGLQHGPGGSSAEANAKQVYSYHVYCAISSTGQPSLPDVCALYEDVLFSMRMSELKRLGVAGFLTGVFLQSSHQLHVLFVLSVCLFGWLVVWLFVWCKSWSWLYARWLSWFRSSSSL